MSTIRVDAMDARPGDLLDFFGTPHILASVEPYEHPTVKAPMLHAIDADGWGIILYDGAPDLTRVVA